MPATCLYRAPHTGSSLGGRRCHSEIFLYYSVSRCTVRVPCWANYWLKMLLRKGKNIHYVAASTEAPWFSIYAVWKSHSSLVSLCVCVTRRPLNHRFFPGSCPSSLPTPVYHPGSLSRDRPGQEPQATKSWAGTASCWGQRCLSTVQVQGMKKREAAAGLSGLHSCGTNGDEITWCHNRE